jgi:hypothetical protein
MNAMPHPTSLLVSLVAEPDVGLLSRITVVLARLDLLPIEIYSRLRNPAGQAADTSPYLEVDMRLAADGAERGDRLVNLLRSIVGVERVMVSLSQPMHAVGQ